MKRRALTAVLLLLTAALSGCIYVGGGRHYHDGEDDYYGDRYDRERGRDHRYDGRRDDDRRYDRRGENYKGDRS